jgi:shikimate kinase
MNNLYLVGFMGTGKSSVGRQVAARTDRLFIDLDVHIENKEKRTIAQIFSQEGEPYFRRLEKEALHEVSLQDNRIVACGGGIVLDDENIKAMKKTGRIVCLTAAAEDILARTSGHRHRPLMNVKDQKAQIENLLAARAHRYALADIIIDTSGLSVDQVVQKVIVL